MSLADMIVIFAMLDGASVVLWLRSRSANLHAAPVGMLTCLRCYTTSYPLVELSGGILAEAMLLVLTLGAYGSALGLIPVGSAFGFGHVALFALAMLPLLAVYQSRRTRTARPACAACGDRRLVPIDSPRAQALRLRAWTNRRGSSPKREAVAR